jgi:hypothetical protein
MSDDDRIEAEGGAGPVGAWRPALGSTERTPRRCFFRDAADRGRIARKPQVVRQLVALRNHHAASPHVFKPPAAHPLI